MVCHFTILSSVFVISIILCKGIHYSFLNITINPGFDTQSCHILLFLLSLLLSSGGAKMLGKLPVPWHPTTLDDSRTRAYCACNKCGLFGHFFSRLSFLFSFSLSLGDGLI